MRSGICFLVRRERTRNQPNKMKATTIQICDFYNETVTTNIRVTPIELDDLGRSQYGHTHYATITESQIAKCKRELANGPRGINVTRQNRDGKEIEAEVYFSL